MMLIKILSMILLTSGVILLAFAAWFYELARQVDSKYSYATLFFGIFAGLGIWGGVNLALVAFREDLE